MKPVAFNLALFQVGQNETVYNGPYEIPIYFFLLP